MADELAAAPGSVLAISAGTAKPPIGFRRRDAVAKRGGR
jgi:hypothetical protein